MQLSQLIFLHLCVSFVVADPCQVPRQGEGILNRIEITDSNQIADINEIISFRAMHHDPNERVFSFIFHFDDVPYETAISPQLKFYDGKELIFGAAANVFYDKDCFYRKTPSNLIEFSVASHYIDKGQIQIQFHPNTEKLVTCQIKMSSAKIVTRKDGKFTEGSLLEYLNKIERDREPPRGGPLPHHLACGSALGGSADRGRSATEQVKSS